MSRWLYAILALAPLTAIDAQSTSGPQWFSAWTVAQDERFPISMNGTSVRMMVRPTISGSAVRVTLENRFGQSPVVFSAAYIGQVQSGAALVPGSNTRLMFNGSPGVTLARGASTYSDPVPFPVRAFVRYAISLDVTTAADISVHGLGLVTNYMAMGAHAADSNANAFSAVPNAEVNPSEGPQFPFYWVAAVDVASASNTGTVVTLGDSITDGYCSTRTNNGAFDGAEIPDLYNRWPDLLATSFAGLPASQSKAVANEGISGNTVVTSGAGPPAVSRLDNDVLSRAGATHVILLEGTNDIGFNNATSATIIAGDHQIIDRVHAAGLKIIGATIIPRGGEGAWTSFQEQQRVALNDWIRHQANFDGLIDFDKLMQGSVGAKTGFPAIPPQWSCWDGVHPNAAGYAAMAGLIDLSLFGPVLNVSHDLVTYGIAKQNMTPDTPSLDSRPLFQAAINYASANHIPNVTADRGKYYFLSLDGPTQHLFFGNLSNLTVDFQYSDLYFALGNIVALSAVNTTNLTLKNFTVDYLQLPFTQLTVTGVNTAANTVSFKQSGNYPLPSYLNSVTVPSNYNVSGYFLFAFRNGKQLRTTNRMETAAPFSDSSIHITNAGASDLASIQPGDTLVLTYRAGFSTIGATTSTGFTLQNVSIYAAGYVGVGATLSTGSTIDHVQIIPRPGTDRLISTNADGIHLAHAGANNMIANNTIRRGCDDAIAIDGQWYATVNAASITSNGVTSVQVTRNGNVPLAIGASFDFIDITNATVAGTATIVSESPPPSQQTGTSGELITLTLDRVINGLQPNFGVTPFDPALRGSGTVISGNLVQEENFVRGIYPAGVKNVTVTDNMIESTNASGILVEQDEALSYYYKTGPSSGITIKNNIVDNALGWGLPGSGVVTAGGAINVVAYDQNLAWVSTQPFSNISITGNFVSNSIRSGIRMENVAGGQITGNTILNYATAPTDFVYALPACCETKAQVEADFMQPIVVAASTSVTNSNNITSGPWTANVSNADGSYRLAPESIAVAYGQNLATTIMQASESPLPPTLGGVTVTVKDSAGVSRPASLYYVSPDQIDYLMPTGTAAGVATVTIGKTASAAFIAPVAPGLFSANGNGKGVAAAIAVRVSSSGAQTPVPVYQCGSTGCASVPMDLGAPTDALVVELYGTGIRGRSSLSNVVAQIGGVPAQIEYAASQFQFEGLDQVNVYVPRTLAGAGEVNVVLTVDGITANVVTINIK